jgi:transcriptional regulator with XRE-family HTH domain
MPSLPLTNYLRTSRKKLALTQEEVAFLLGVKGEGRGAKVCRDETFTREPSLKAALAYEAIYHMPVRDLFAGLYQQVEQEVAGRAKILNFRKDLKPSRRTEYRRQVLAALATGQSGQIIDPPKP